MNPLSQKPPRRMSGVIYEPKGRAKEYSLLACNLYAGCVHGCDYCYVPAAVHVPKEKFHSKVVPRERILERLAAEAPSYAGTDKRVLLCFTCDPYQPIPAELDVTRKAIEILREHDIPFQVLTKGGMRAARDFDLYGPNDAFATTLTLASDEDSEDVEPKAALPSDRAEAIRLAKSRGIQTWVSLEPVLSVIDSLEAIEVLHDVIDLYKIGKLNHSGSDIDWRAFGIEAIELCEKYGVSYYIKDDLAKYLDGVEYTNTDSRRVDRGE